MAASRGSSPTHSEAHTIHELPSLQRASESVPRSSVLHVQLDGASDILDSATGHLHELQVMAALLQRSAHHLDPTITVTATRTRDAFLVSNTPNGTIFVRQLRAYWRSHISGVDAMRDHPSRLVQLFASRMFVNFAEPVVDVRAVVVLYNPVSSSLNQRQSRTVTTFWTRFEEAGGNRDEWEGHIVFLDLVPLLDSGKQGVLTREEKAQKKQVTDAAKERIFTRYVITLIQHYAKEAGCTAVKKFPVILCAGKSEHKRAAVQDFTSSLSHLEQLKLYDCVYHPMANESRQIVPVLRQLILDEAQAWVQSQSAPQSAAPQSAAPQSAAPQSAAPQSAAPQPQQ